MQPIHSYYEKYDEDGRLRSNHGMVEFLTTMRYIERYLKPGARVLEIGAATGRYSLALADKGFAVDAVELVEHNIGIFKSNIKPGQNVTVRQGNAVELNFIESETYDATLLLGPMYHLFTEQDKLRALHEAIRVTKPQGVVFVAYCVSDVSVLDYGFKRGMIWDLLDKDMVETEHFNTFSKVIDIFELVRKEDVFRLMEHFNVTRLHYVSTDLYTNHMREAVDAMDERTFELYLRYHFSICEREDMCGLSHHTLDIFRKE